MSIDLEHLRSRNPIEEVVNEKVSLKKQGNRFVGVEHDSLVVTPKTGFYFWNSRDEHGDVFDFVGRYDLGYGSGWNHRDVSQFMEAVKFLAQRAGITIVDNKEFRRSHVWAERQLVARLHEALLKHKPVLEYATKTRGWQLSTPANFDAAAIRHQLYTLALTSFMDVHRNYFERPDLHRLHNRSSELWSPLVALAAYFEEQGSVAGLLQAISDAAEWDEQVSEGKALSDREEAVLQALEVMTRGQSETIWLKAGAVREEVAKLLGHPADKFGDAQWIGHMLNRLHLLDDGGRKRMADGMTYAIQPVEVRDMMRRYEVLPIENAKG